MALALSSSSTAPSSSFPQGATPPNFVMTPAQLTAAVLNLGQQLAGIRDLLLQRQVDDFSAQMAALAPVAWPPSKPVWSPPSPPVWLPPSTPVWSPPSPSVCPPSTPGWPPTVALAPVECLPPFLPYGLPGYSGLHELPAALPFVSAQPASPVIDLPAPSSAGAQLAGLVLGVPAPPFASTQQGAPALSFASTQPAFPAIGLPPEHSFAGEQPSATTITGT